MHFKGRTDTWDMIPDFNKRYDVHNETWVNVIVADDKYECSSLGRIRNRDTNTLVRQSMNQCGYVQVSLSDAHRKNKVLNTSVHNIVLSSFTKLTSIKGVRCIDHIDQNRFNNCLDNLEYVSYKENNRRKSKHKRYSIYCVEDDLSFSSILEAERYYGFYINSLYTSFYHSGNTCSWRGKSFQKVLK